MPAYRGTTSPSLSWQISFNTPLEMHSVDTGDGDSSRAFNTPLEMPKSIWFLSSFVHQTILSILHWRCWLTSTKGVSLVTPERTFNTPLEMRCYSCFMSDVSGPYYLSILHWRCVAERPAGHAAVPRCFQYSIGDAVALLLLTWLRE